MGRGVWMMDLGIKPAGLVHAQCPNLIGNWLRHRFPQGWNNRYDPLRSVIHRRNLMLVPTLGILLTLASAPPASARLPFINDDYARARAVANQRKLPLFVDVWAPW